MLAGIGLASPVSSSSWLAGELALTQVTLGLMQVQRSAHPLDMVALTPLERARIERLLRAADKEAANDPEAQRLAAEQARQTADREREAAAQVAKLAALRGALESTHAVLYAQIRACRSEGVGPTAAAWGKLRELRENYEAAFDAEGFVAQLGDMSPEGVSLSLSWAMKVAFPEIFYPQVRQQRREDEARHAAAVVRQNEDAQRNALVKAIVNTHRKVHGKPPLNDSEIILIGDRRKNKG
jgi:hypothetical protein